MLQILLLFLLVQELVRRMAAGLADPTLVEAPLLMISALLLIPALLLKPVPLLVPILVDVMMMLRNWLVRRLVGRLADPTLAVGTPPAAAPAATCTTHRCVEVSYIDINEVKYQKL